jgi:ribosome-associated translation inhibitor RaiA
MLQVDCVIFCFFAWSVEPILKSPSTPLQEVPMQIRIDSLTGRSPGRTKNDCTHLAKPGLGALSSTSPAEGWRESTERRVRFVLRRLRGKVQQVHVRLRDLNGTRGGPDQVCQVSIVTEGQGTLVASAVGAHPRQALDAALQGVPRLVRSFKRRQQTARPGSRPCAPCRPSERTSVFGISAHPIPTTPEFPPCKATPPTAPKPPPACWPWPWWPTATIP